MKTLTILLQDDAGGGSMGMFLMLGAMFLIMWLFFIRPQQKKAKEAQKFRDQLAKGDRVVTIGGLHGKILVDKSAVSADNSPSEQEVAAKS
jgi:preprotein translocase subunit YajC